MSEFDELYSSCLTKGSYFNKMIDCGRFNLNIERILRDYLPTDILDEYKDKLYIINTTHVDACRITPAIRENREMILLSERIFPKSGMNEGNIEYRYFIFTVLHEIVHAIRNHRSPLLDNLSKEAITAQEKEADDLAIEWFNKHIDDRDIPSLKPVTIEEMNEAREIYRKKQRL